MSVFSAMNISATGMTAQRMAMSTKGNPWYLKKKIMYLSMMLL